MYFSKNIKNMRSFHNKIKLLLIKRSVIGKSNVTLVDAGVGRGGDMFKWDKCNIHTVIGYDVCHPSIVEANSRYDNSGLRKTRNYTFVVCHSIFELRLSKKVQTISCQFAIHYLFQSQERLRMFLRDVSDNLENNGMFIGTFLNGDRLNELPNHFSNKCFYIDKKYDDTDNALVFGREIHFHISGTVYFGENTVSIEYVVSPDILQQECERVGLHLIEFTPFQAYYDDLNYGLDEDHKTCSFLYDTFCFKKKKLSI